MDDRDGLIMSACLTICEAIWGSTEDVARAIKRYDTSEMAEMALRYRDDVQLFFRLARCVREQDSRRVQKHDAADS